MATRQAVELKSCFSDTRLNAMHFLNAVVAEYPAAISFAPGFPLDALGHIEQHAIGAASFVREAARRMSTSTEQVWRTIGQYSRTNGIINDIIAAQLALDEGIHVEPADVIVTVGAQEAMAIVLAGLFDPGRDILLVSDPTYVGMTGLASLLGIRVVPVATGDDGLEPAAVERAIVSASQEGRVRALYDIPDFNNPLGTSLDLTARRKLLDVCHRHGVLVIEDNVYGMFAYERDRLPTLKALDRDAGVLYIGSFSKTLFPGLRVGYLVADQRVTPKGERLTAALSRVKSLLTVNTSPLMQAIAGGILLEAGGSLARLVEPKCARYRSHRDAMVAALRESFAEWQGSVSWKTPDGGFFLPVTLPFEFGATELRQCAVDYGVIVCPMQYFCLGRSRATQVRLSFSYVEPDQIRTGIARFASYVRAHASAGAAAERRSG